MLVKIEEINVRGNKALEDTSYFCSGFSFVLDGASSLIKTKITDYESDPQWLALRFKEEISKYSIIDSPKAILHEIMNKLKVEFSNLYADELTEDMYPSAGLSLVYEKGEDVNIFQLGDCSILVKFNNGTVKEYANHTITKLDDIAINKMAEIAKTENIDVADARSKVNDILIKHRNYKNKLSGYMILDPTGEGIDRADEYILKKDEIDSILIMSDGFRSCIDTFHMYSDNEAFFDECINHSLSYVCEKLFKLQDEDEKLNNYPRLKKRDDTTALMIKVK